MPSPRASAGRFRSSATSNNARSAPGSARPSAAACRKNSRTAASTQLTRRSPRTGREKSGGPARAGSSKRSQCTNRPSARGACGHASPAPSHQSRNSASEIAYAFVLDSARSRPRRMCSKNPSAGSATRQAPSSTVQYRTPDGSRTRNARYPPTPPSRTRGNRWHVTLLSGC